MNKLKRFAILSLTLVALNVVVVPSIALAIDGPTGPTGTGIDGPTGPSAGTGGGLKNPLNNINSLPDFMNAILDGVIQLGSILLLLAIVYVGFLFVKAQGKEEEIKNARDALMWTVIGGLILLGAKTIGLVISSTVGAL